MNELEKKDFFRIAEAIDYIRANFKENPSLEEVSSFVGLSSSHFQRLFSSWVGVSPKKFQNYLSLDYAKNLIKKEKASLLNISEKSGFSSTSRLHDLFTKIEAMTPREYRDGGSGLTISYSYSNTIFGKVMLASTDKGLCYLGFEDLKNQGLERLKNDFPKAKYQHRSSNFHENALKIFRQDWKNIQEVKLHLRATDFQIKVWESLLRIPVANLATYSQIAGSIQQDKASRAVGSAIGKNPIAFIIPCHRVIRANGDFGNYMWDSKRKSTIIAWEAFKEEQGFFNE